MKTQLRTFVNDCLQRFEREDRLQLASEQASAESRGHALPEVCIPPSCLLRGRIRAPSDLFDVEVALMLFDRQQTAPKAH
jgi:hypothetical protein